MFSPTLFQDYYHAVALMKKDSLPEIQSLNDLRGRHACFAGVGTQARHLDINIYIYYM